MYYFEFSEHGDKTHSQIWIKLQNKYLILTKNRPFFYMKKKITELKTYFLCKFSILEGHFSMNMVKKCPKNMDLDFFQIV